MAVPRARKNHKPRKVNETILFCLGPTQFTIQRHPIFRQRSETTLVATNKVDAYWSNEATAVQIEARQIYQRRNGDLFRVSLAPSTMVRVLLEMRPEVLAEAVSQHLANSPGQSGTVGEMIGALAKGLAARPAPTKKSE